MSQRNLDGPKPTGFGDSFTAVSGSQRILAPGSRVIAANGEMFVVNEPLPLNAGLFDRLKGDFAFLYNYYDFTFYQPGTVRLVRAKGWRRWFGKRWVHDFDNAVIRNTARATNLIPTVALTDVLAVYLAAGTPKTTWYAGLVNNVGFTTFAAGDTIASHGGWTEWQTYSESVRQTWTPAAASGGSITNSAAMVFTPSADAVIHGAFLVSNSTKGGTGGLMYSEAGFDAGNQTLTNGTAFRMNATFTATSVT